MTVIEPFLNNLATIEKQQKGRYLCTHHKLAAWTRCGGGDKTPLAMSTKKSNYADPTNYHKTTTYYHKLVIRTSPPAGSQAEIVIYPSISSEDAVTPVCIKLSAYLAKLCMATLRSPFPGWELVNLGASLTNSQHLELLLQQQAKTPSQH